MHAGTLTPLPTMLRSRSDLLQVRLAWTAVTASLVLLDVVALLSAFAIAYWIRFRSAIPLFREGTDSIEFYATVIVWALPTWLLIFAAWRLYDRRVLFSGYNEYARVGRACTAGVLAIIIISFLYDTPSIARAWLLLVWVASITLVWTARFIARRVVRRLRAHGLLLTRAIIVGTDGESAALAQRFAADLRCGVNIVGIVEGSQPTESERVEGVETIGSLMDLEALVVRQRVEVIIIANGAVSRPDMMDLYRRFAHRGDVELRMSSGLFEIVATGIRVQPMGSVPLTALERVRITGVDAVLKTLLDVSIASLAVAILSPVYILVAIAVKLDAGGPVIYRRRVLGRSGKPFDAFKFRTMIPDRRQTSLATSFPDRRHSDKTSADPRVTRFGKFLRRTSLDELPQLLNVLRGEMSLIGPRMVSPDEVVRYGKWQLNLLTVKPGITGPWQVRGRSDIPYEERVRLSTEYVRNYSIWLDLQILLQTVPVVIKGTGAY